MALLNSVLSWIIKKRIHQIELFKKYPHEVQEEWLRKLINSAKDTEWGLKYDFKSIKTYADFCEHVPVNDYDSLKPYIERLRNGEQNLLWPSEIRWFAQSSGTTNDKSKFIPVSEESLEDCHYKGGKDMLSIYFNNNPDSNFFDGRGLALTGSHRIKEVNNEDYYTGDLSAIIIQNLPFWIEFIRVPKRSVALMDNWEIKIEEMAKTSIEYSLTSLSGVPSWTLLLLKRILEISGKENISEVWPDLEVFFHGGVNFAPYRKQFLKLIPSPKMHFVETYNASEGFFGIQDQLDSNELLLMLDYGIFYEFLPIDQVDIENKKPLPLSKVKLHTNYAMLISTNAGLWRYMIGDTIEFTNLSPYRIRITGRTKSFINAVGEEVIIDNAETALAEACLVNQALISEYTAAPIYADGDKRAAHEWVIEFEIMPKNIEDFTNSLDKALQSLNSDYEAKRFNDMILEKPILRVVPKGTFYKWLKKRGKLGGQNKVPRLSNNRIYIDELLEDLKF